MCFIYVHVETYTLVIFSSQKILYVVTNPLDPIPFFAHNIKTIFNNLFPKNNSTVYIVFMMSIVLLHLYFLFFKKQNSSEAGRSYD